MRSPDVSGPGAVGLAALLAFTAAIAAAQESAPDRDAPRLTPPLGETLLVESLNPSQSGSSPTDGVEVDGWSLAASVIVVIGGDGNPADPRGLLEQNEAYDPRRDEWNAFAPLPTPVHGLGAAAFVDGRIHLPGGAVTQGGNTGSNLHQVFPPPADCR